MYRVCDVCVSAMRWSEICSLTCALVTTSSLYWRFSLKNVWSVSLSQWRNSIRPTLVPRLRSRSCPLCDTMGIRAHGAILPIAVGPCPTASGIEIAGVK